MTKIVALTGATGYVGRFVTAELQRHNVKVRALTRPDSDRRGFTGPVEWVIGDMLSAEALSKLVTGVDAVVHLAYEHVPGFYRGGEGNDLPCWLESNVNGSLRLLLAAREAKVERFVFLSSRAVFSRTEPGRELNESHPTSPDTHYGAYKAAVEAFLSSFAQMESMKTYAVRATGVYGVTWPVQSSKWWGLVKTVLNDEVVSSTRGGTEVHGHDVAKVIWELLDQLNIESGVIHLSDLYVTHRDLVQIIRQLADRPGPLPLPPSSPPVNRLVCNRLADLGITLSGLPALEATLAEMVRAAEQE